MIIQIIGLPGSGKTELARALQRKTNSIHLNADEIRNTVNTDLGFSDKDRIEQSRRMGAMAKVLSSQGFSVIVDFICPTEETRKAFGKADLIVWVDRIKSGRFEDTNNIWKDPEKFDIRILDGYTIEQEVQMVMQVGQIFDWTEPTTLMLGRYQPWHEGHQALKEKAHERTKQVLVGVRNTYGTSEKDPLKYNEVVKHIKENNPSNRETLIISLPNITNIVYGRDVGYKIEQVKLDEETESISATKKRKEMGL